MSLRTPARVRMRPDPTLIKKTAATWKCQRKKHSRLPETDIEGKGNSGIGEKNEKSNSVQGVEWFESFGEGKETCIDDRTDWCVVMERDNRVHLNDFSASVYRLCIEELTLRP